MIIAWARDYRPYDLKTYTEKVGAGMKQIEADLFDKRRDIL